MFVSLNTRNISCAFNQQTTSCLLKNSIHDKIKHSYFSKTQARAVCCASDVTDTNTKWLAYKVLYYMILKYLLKYKYTKEVVSEIDIIANLWIQ